MIKSSTMDGLLMARICACSTITAMFDAMTVLLLVLLLLMLLLLLLLPLLLCCCCVYNSFFG
jgi:hypothetical protein